MVPPMDREEVEGAMGGTIDGSGRSLDQEEVEGAMDDTTDRLGSSRRSDGLERSRRSDGWNHRWIRKQLKVR